MKQMQADRNRNRSLEYFMGKFLICMSAAKKYHRIVVKNITFSPFKACNLYTSKEFCLKSCDCWSTDVSLTTIPSENDIVIEIQLHSKTKTYNSILGRIHTYSLEGNSTEIDA